MNTNNEAATCCICGQIWRKSYKGVDYKPDQYATHGRGKNRVINYFHWECFEENTIGWRKTHDQNRQISHN